MDFYITKLADSSPFPGFEDYEYFRCDLLLGFEDEDLGKKYLSDWQEGPVDGWSPVEALDYFLRCGWKVVMANDEIFWLRKECIMSAITENLKCNLCPEDVEGVARFNERCHEIVGQQMNLCAEIPTEEIITCFEAESEDAWKYLDEVFPNWEVQKEEMARALEAGEDPLEWF